MGKKNKKSICYALQINLDSLVIASKIVCTIKRQSVLNKNSERRIFDLSCTEIKSFVEIAIEFVLMLAL